MAADGMTMAIKFVREHKKNEKMKSVIVLGTLRRHRVLRISPAMNILITVALDVVVVVVVIY